MKTDIIIILIIVIAIKIVKIKEEMIIESLQKIKIENKIEFKVIMIEVKTIEIITIKESIRFIINI